MATLDRCILLILDDIAYVSKYQSETRAISELLQPAMSAGCGSSSQISFRGMVLDLTRPSHDTRRG